MEWQAHLAKAYAKSVDDGCFSEAFSGPDFSRIPGFDLATIYEELHDVCVVVNVVRFDFTSAS